MAVNLEQHILDTLATTPQRARGLTIGDLARQFGVNPAVVLQAARRLVDDGLASPAMVNVHGVPTLRGLFPAGSTATMNGAPSPG
jgi:hypothetical protein